MARSSASRPPRASRALWKGAISFGLVHVPVSLHAATIESGVDFDWLDKRSMDPVGYKRINKRTGKEITKENIVKGVAWGEGRYVVLGEDEIEAVYPRSTQTVEIESFVSMSEIPFVYLDRPYYLAPVGKGQKVYALLREALARTGRVGLARVVIQTKQHLAALVPAGPALVLNLLRWSDDIRSWDDLPLPAAGVKGAGLKDRELQMATQLIEDMSAPFDPADHADRFKAQVMALVEKKAKAGKAKLVLEPEEEAPAGGAEVIDLTELLQKSLRAKPAAPKKASRRKRAA
jgi:DNA end-binding protein Ku